MDWFVSNEIVLKRFRDVRVGSQEKVSLTFVSLHRILPWKRAMTCLWLCAMVIAILRWIASLDSFASREEALLSRFQVVLVVKTMKAKQTIVSKIFMHRFQRQYHLILLQYSQHLSQLLMRLFNQLLRQQILQQKPLQTSLVCQKAQICHWSVVLVIAILMYV